MLGQGTYGKVYRALLEKDDGTKEYAMKIIRKDKLKSRELIQSTKLELNILNVSDNPFILSADYFF